MQKLHFEILINAPVEKVWNSMFEDATYREWTEAFHPGSYYKGSWEEGAKILFLGPGEDGKEGGMVSYIRENRPHEFVSIEHVGLVMDGVEDTTSEAVKKWTPAFENYTFTEKDGGTEVSVDIDLDDENKAMFEGVWPVALEKLKEIAER